ncbi:MULTISPECIES: CsbD family protein [unclassified Arthrobacter]|uniref:CsbD family protein n=1 Tax=unclassified Arthrobacter TaxID=235627 RepID=UPI001DDB27E3|nr:CsbD family protein [Arthrobacter sp. Bi26]CAH0219646.1 hypothetical protein SRABI26_02372 [Arthrobacter sp. Bi26]
MGIDGKAKLTVIHHIGAAKEGTGTMTGNEDLKRDGQHEQARPKRAQLNCPAEPRYLTALLSRATETRS